MKLLHFPEDGQEIRGILEHAELTTLIRPNITEQDIENAVAAAKKYGFRSVAALPPQAEQVCKALEGSGILTTCVYDMLSGAISRWDATKNSVEAFSKMGIAEFDVMLSLPDLAAGDFAGMAAHWGRYVSMAHTHGVKVFATIEKGFFDDATIVSLCGLASKAGADGVRTVTGCRDLSGIDGGRTTIHDVCLIRKMLPQELEVKASGGQDYMYLEDAHALLACGASTVDLGECALAQLAAIGYEKEA